MRGLRVCLFAGLAAALTACTRAPDADALKADVGAVVEANFAPGLLEVVSARPTEALPYMLARSRPRVSYDAELKLARAHRFGAWDELNVGVLALLLDAPAERISGIKRAGNAAGDIIRVRGRLSYRKDEQGALKPDTGPAISAGPGKPGLVLLADIENAAKETWDGLRQAARGSRAAVMVEEWRRAQRAVAARTARMQGGFAVASGLEGTPSWQLGDAAARAADEQGIPFANIATGSAQEAFDLLRDGRVTAAIARNTETALAAAADAPYASSGPYRLSALAALYPEPVHVIVKDASALGSPADLYGKHVGVAGGSRAAAAEAEAVLRGHGVAISSLAAPLIPVAMSDALAQLEAGAFDALIMTSPLPNPEVHQLAARHPIRLLPFDSDAIALLTTGVAAYVAVTIPARTYPSQTRPIAAVAAVTMLVSLDAVPEKEAAALLGFVLNEVDYLRLGSLAGTMIGRQEAARPLALPWHSGAVAFFEAGAKE